MAEVTLRPGLCAIGADPGFRHVEIDLHDPPLAPHGFDPEGEPRLQPLAEKPAALPQEHVFGGLLTDGRSATLAFPRQTFLDRLFDRFGIKAEMFTEPRILRRDHR